MSKKFLILTSVVLGIILIGLVGYYVATKDGGENEPGGIVSGFKSFFPFGGNDLPPTETATTTEEIPTPNEQQPELNFTQKLRKLSSEPVAGAGTLDIKAGTVVRYIEKATGHIFEVELFSPKQSRLSNTTIPVVYDALWGNKSDSLIARYLKDDNVTVDTYSLTVKNLSTSTENTITGVALPKSIHDVSTLGASIFYLVQNDNSSLGYVSNFDGSKAKQIWNSDIREVSSQYVNGATVALTTNPAQYVPGYLYFINTTSGQIRKILGDIAGLSTITDSKGENVVYLEQHDGAKTSIYNIKTKTISSFDPSTFPEKCVWSKKDLNTVYCAVARNTINGNSLTLWYQGQISYNDDIWKYDIKNNTAGVVGSLSQDNDEGIDVIKPILSENEQYLVFMNKKDNTLWSLDLLK